MTNYQSSTTPERGAAYTWMTTAEVAEYLRISKSKLEKDRSKGLGLPYNKLGKTVRYRKDQSTPA